MSYPSGFWIIILGLGVTAFIAFSQMRRNKDNLERVQKASNEEDYGELEFPFYYTRFDTVDFGPTWQRIYENVEVAGIHYKRSEVDSFISDLEGFFYECHCFLALVREPDNEFDKNAIKVVAAIRTEDEGTKQHLIGYVPRYIAAAIAKNQPATAQLSGKPILIKATNEDVDFSFDIYVKLA